MIVLENEEQKDTKDYLITLRRSKRLRQMTINIADVTHNQRVLNVGSGTGEIALLVKRKVGELGYVVGIDSSKQMVEYAKKKSILED